LSEKKCFIAFSKFISNLENYKELEEKIQS